MLHRTISAKRVAEPIKLREPHLHDYKSPLKIVLYNIGLNASKH